jgi:hypothetical protein
MGRGGSAPANGILFSNRSLKRPRPSEPLVELAGAVERTIRKRRALETAAADERVELERSLLETERAYQTLRDAILRPPAWFANLRGPGGNAYVVMGQVSEALRRDGQGELVDIFRQLAMSGNYEQLLATCDEFVTPLMGDPPRLIDSLVAEHAELQYELARERDDENE